MKLIIYSFNNELMVIFFAKLAFYVR